MGYYDMDYILDDNYGDEDQNDLMWLIQSWRGEDEDDPEEPENDGDAEVKPVLTVVIEPMPGQDDELPF